MELGSLLTLVITSLTLVCFVPEGEGTVFLIVNTTPVDNGQCFKVGSTSRVSVWCKYFNDLPHLTELQSDGHTFINLQIVNGTYLGGNALLYRPPLGYRGRHVYRCQDSSSTVTVTVSFDAPCVTTVSTTAHPNTIPSPSSSSAIPPTSPGGGGQNSPKFTGLNPLIYTISAVILLGTLSIVSIITCWIRARRSFNNRVLHANNTPQDYLDYISDNEFTPLTTSEFVASLQERPPTYHQSEQIEQDAMTGNTENTDSTTNNDSTISTNTTGTGNSLPPPPNRPLPPILTLSPEVQNRASDGSGDTTASPVQSTISNRSPVTNILDMDAWSGTQGVTPSQSMSGSEHISPAIVIGTLIDVEVEQSSVSSPETMSSPTALVDDMLSLTPEQIGEIEATVGAVNVHLGCVQEPQRTE